MHQQFSGHKMRLETFALQPAERIATEGLVDFAFADDQTFSGFRIVRKPGVGPKVGWYVNQMKVRRRTEFWENLLYTVFEVCGLAAIGLAFVRVWP